MNKLECYIPRYQPRFFAMDFQEGTDRRLVLVGDLHGQLQVEVPVELG